MKRESDNFLCWESLLRNEQQLEDDYNTLIEYLLAQDTNYFLYRDFQSRNIMLRDGKPCFIDYQGGRKGALQYDVASLLFDSKADIPPEVRENLLEHYIQGLKQYPEVNPEAFRESFYAYVLIRIMQAMGAYGFRGFYEKKTHFLQSIPYALDDLKWILENVKFANRNTHPSEGLWETAHSPETEALPGQGRTKVNTYRFHQQLLIQTWHS